MPAIRPLDLPNPPECNRELIEYLRVLLKRLHTEQCDYLRLDGILVNDSGGSEWIDWRFPDDIG